MNKVCRLCRSLSLPILWGACCLPMFQCSGRASNGCPWHIAGRVEFIELDVSDINLIHQLLRCCRYSRPAAQPASRDFNASAKPFPMSYNFTFSNPFPHELQFYLNIQYFWSSAYGFDKGQYRCANHPNERHLETGPQTVCDLSVGVLSNSFHGS
jgi:hypothetical protein